MCPTPVAGEVVKAFVTLGDGYEWSDELRLDLVGFARRRLGAAVAAGDHARSAPPQDEVARSSAAC